VQTGNNKINGGGSHGDNEINIGNGDGDHRSVQTGDNSIN
jgi:hypothetical protein